MLWLGIVLFFLLAEKRPFAAGAVLLLPMAKPQFFALLWPILLAWIIARRKWRLLGGMAVAFLSANAIALGLEPAIFRHYHQILRLARLRNEFMSYMVAMVRGLC